METKKSTPAAIQDARVSFEFRKSPLFNDTAALACMVTFRFAVLHTYTFHTDGSLYNVALYRKFYNGRQHAFIASVLKRE